MNKKHSPKPPRILQVRRDRDYDCVYLQGKKIILGRSGTPEAEAAYRKLQIQVLTDPTLTSFKPQQVLVDNLCLAYLEYAEEHDPGHFSSIKTAIEILLQHYAGQPVDTLDTRHFLFLQEQFVGHNVSRQYCNALILTLIVIAIGKMNEKTPKDLLEGFMKVDGGGQCVIALAFVCGTFVIGLFVSAIIGDAKDGYRTPNLREADRQYRQTVQEHDRRMQERNIRQFEEGVKQFERGMDRFDRDNR